MGAGTAEATGCHGLCGAESGKNGGRETKDSLLLQGVLLQRKAEKCSSGWKEILRQGQV